MGGIRIILVIALLSRFLATAPGISAAAEIKMLSGSAMDPVFQVLLPQFEQSSGHWMVLDSDGAIGFMAERRKGEAADVVIVSRTQIEALILRRLFFF
jgi:ABC-type molybdate transport system substrate-binding protein